MQPPLNKMDKSWNKPLNKMEKHAKTLKQNGKIMEQTLKKMEKSMGWFGGISPHYFRIHIHLTSPKVFVPASLFPWAVTETE